MTTVSPPTPPAPSTPPTPSSGGRAPARSSAGLFRAFWRWHFYASFLVVPILLLLSVTGLIYLFRFQIEPLMHGDVMRVEAPADVEAAQAVPLTAQVEAVEAAYPGASIDLVAEGRERDEATVVSITRADGSATDVYADPWTGEVLGSLDPTTTLSGYALRLHGDLMSGRWGDGLIEVAACWAIVMALTGYYLFVAGRGARLKRRAKRATGAALRHRHALVGSVAGVGILFMVVTGLPWTGFWGEKVQSIATERGSSLWSTDPGAQSVDATQPGTGADDHSDHGDHSEHGAGGDDHSEHGGSDPAAGQRLDEAVPSSKAAEVPWGQGASGVPTSDPAAATTAGEVSIDTAVAAAEEQGLRHPMKIVPPADETGVYSVMGDAFHDPSREQTAHVDQYTGEVRAGYGFDDYPLLAKTVSQGIGLHEGRSLGLVSFWGAAAFCAAVIFLCVSGPLMWWRRRPSGSRSVGAPRGRLPVRTTWWLAAGLVALGVFLPLFGITLLAVLVLDQVVLRRIPRLSTTFDVTP